MPSLMFVPKAVSEELKQTDSQNRALYIRIRYLPVLPAPPGSDPPSVMSGFSMAVQPAKPPSLIRLLCEQ